MKLKGLNKVALSVISDELREIMAGLTSAPIVMNDVPNVLLVNHKFHPSIADVCILLAISSSKNVAGALILSLDVALPLDTPVAKIARRVQYVDDSLRNHKGLQNGGTNMNQEDLKALLQTSYQYTCLPVLRTKASSLVTLEEPLRPTAYEREAPNGMSNPDGDGDGSSTSHTKSTDSSLSWVEIGTTVYVYQGSERVRGHRAEGYHGTVVRLRADGRFKVKSALVSATRTEHGAHLYKSMADAPIPSKQWVPVAFTPSHSEKRKSNKLELDAVQAAKKNAKIEAAAQKERTVLQKELNKEKRRCSQLLGANKDEITKLERSHEREMKKSKKESDEKDEKLKQLMKELIEAGTKQDYFEKQNLKQEELMASLFRGEFCGDGQLTQAGDRIVEKYRLILEEAVNRTTEKRLGNVIKQLEQQAEEFRNTLAAKDEQIDRLRDSKNHYAADLRKERSKPDSAARSEVKYAKCQELLSDTNSKLRDAVKELEINRENAQRWEQIPKLVRELTKGKPYSVGFVKHAMAVMSTGASSVVAREIIILTAEYLLPNEKFDVPAVAWFNDIRESLGTEAELFTYIKAAGAFELLQLGMDETKIDGQSTLNIWLNIRPSKDSDETEIIFLSCAGILVGGTADMVSKHVAKKFEEAQESLMKLRALLTSQGFDADELIPMVNGGLVIERVKSLMHDTCNTANATARKLVELITEKMKGTLSEAEWAAVDEKDKYILDFLCANHTRGLPLTHFNKLASNYLKDILGDYIDESKQAGFTRAQFSGENLVYSIRKLCYDGWGEYFKGDGRLFREFVIDKAPKWSNYSMGRADTGKRQDGPMEKCPIIFVLMPILREYATSGLELPENTLRDAVMVQLQLLPYEAYIQTNAIIWLQVFEELRALTNSNEVNLNPVELNQVYDMLYEYAVRAQTADDDDLLKVFDKDFSIFPAHAGLKGWRENRNSKKLRGVGGVDEGLYHEAMLNGVSKLADRDDGEWDNYKPHLVATLRMFWSGLISSFEYTSKKYLSALDGEYSNKMMLPWQKELAQHLLAHNNNAESPFALAKWFAKHFNSMSLTSITALTMAKKNHTHAREVAATKKTSGQEAGLARTSAPEIQLAVSLLSSTKKSHSAVSIIREHRERDAAAIAAGITLDKQNRNKVFAANALSIEKASAKHNNADEVVLWESVAEMDGRLEAIQSCLGNKAIALTMQVRGRIEGKKFVYAGFDAKFLKLGGHIRMSPAGKNGVREVVAYLTELLTLMIVYDIQHKNYVPGRTCIASPQRSLYRPVPEAPFHLKCESVKRLQQEAGEKAQSLSVTEDPTFQQYDKYRDKVFYDADEKKCYRIVQIEYDKAVNPATKEEVGFIASSVQVDLDGNELTGNRTSAGFLIDKMICPYTLENNQEGFSMDEMIAAYDTKVQHKVQQRKRSR